MLEMQQQLAIPSLSDAINLLEAIVFSESESLPTVPYCMCDLHLEEGGGTLVTFGISSLVKWQNTSEISVLSVRKHKE